MSSSTSKIGPLSSSVVAALTAGGIFVCVAMIVVVALIMDLPNRIKRRKEKNTGIMAPDGKHSMEISEVEKGSGDASTMQVSSTNVSTNYSSIRPTRPASPECTCDHPAVAPKPPRV